MVVQHVLTGSATAADGTAGKTNVVATAFAAGIALIEALQQVLADDAAQQQNIVFTLEMRARQS